MVMSTETAAPAQGATAAGIAVGELPQPPAEATPQLAPDPVATPATEAPPETDPAATPETPAPDYNKLLADLPDEEFEKLDRVSRKAESARRQAEAQTRRQQAVESSEWLTRGEFAQELVTSLQLDEQTGAPRLDPQKLAATAGRMLTAQTQMVVSLMGQVVGEEIPADFQLSKAEADRLEDAKIEFIKDHRQAPALVKEWMSTVKRVAVEQAKPELRKEIEREVRAELAAAARTEATRRADAAQSQQPAPTRVTGSNPAVTWSSQIQLDTAHARNEITTAEYRRLRSDGTYGSLPYS